jgi:hypothetical protein
MSVYAVNYTLDKGTDFETELNLTEDDGSSLNLVGYTAAAKIRKHPTAPKYKPFTITFIDREKGRLKISLSNTQTSGLQEGRNYYDLLLTDGTGKGSYGVIAQELEEILPDLVKTGEVKSVNYNGLIGVLIEAVKELKAEVEELKSKS